MEVKNSASRMRVFAAALGLGLVIGAYSYVTSPDGSFYSSGGTGQSAPKSPSGEKPSSPGAATGLLPASAPGKSLPAPFTGSLGTTPVLTPLQIAWRQSTIRMKYLDQCERSGTCAAFENDQAWSYDLDVRRQTAAELEAFTSIAQSWKTEHGGDLPEEAQKLARYFLETGNDDVKEAALGLILLAEPSEANVSASLQAVAHSASGPLVKFLLTSKIVDTSATAAYAPMWNSFINETMKTGGEGVQKNVARYSLNILSEQTMASLAQVEKQQAPRSKNALYLRLNREEFERQRRGG